MAEKLGENYVVRIGDGATTEVFTEVAGQRSLTYNASSSLIPTSHKTTGRYGTSAAGRSEISIDVEGILDLPDANGLEAVITGWQADPNLPINFQIYDKVAAGAIFECSMYISNLAYTHNDQEASTYSFTLSLAAAPTTDDLTP